MLVARTGTYELALHFRSCVSRGWGQEIMPTAGGSSGSAGWKLAFHRPLQLLVPSGNPESAGAQGFFFLFTAAEGRRREVEMGPGGREQLCIPGSL